MVAYGSTRSNCKVWLEINSAALAQAQLLCNCHWIRELTQWWKDCPVLRCSLHVKCKDELQWLLQLISSISDVALPVLRFALAALVMKR